MTKRRDEKLASLDRRHFAKMRKEAKRKRSRKEAKLMELAKSLAELRVKSI